MFDGKVKRSGAKVSDLFDGGGTPGRGDNLAVKVRIYVKSHRAGYRVMESSTKFLETKLKLTVNPEKSEVGSPTKLKFLGFSLGKDASGVFIRVHVSFLKRLKDKIRRSTKRNRGISLTRMLYELK